MNAWETFKESFKLKMNFVNVILLDLIFYVIAVPCFYLSAFLINNKASQIDMPALQAAMASTQTAEQVQAVLGDVKSMVIVMILIAAMFFVVSLFAYSLSRSLIWNYLANAKFKCVKYLKLVLLNLVLFIITAVVIFLLFLLMKVNYWAGVVLFYVVIVLIAYFVYMIYLEYAKTARIFASIGNAFKRINRKAAVSYLLCLLVYGILFAVYWIVSWYGGMGTVDSIIFYFILSLLFFAWMRLYVLKVNN